MVIQKFPYIIVKASFLFLFHLPTKPLYHNSDQISASSFLDVKQTKEQPNRPIRIYISAPFAPVVSHRHIRHCVCVLKFG